MISWRTIMNRREFLQASAAGLVFSAAGGYAAEFLDQKAPRVGLIGTGWYAKSDLFRLIQVAPVEVVSLCDVDRNMVAEAADMTATRQRPKRRRRVWSDYRKMLAEKGLDIVHVGPPDHWHALAMIEAVKSGTDVWCQKPI